ncbi:unnamed protein product, partial [Ectocarpus sp. 12 AP-2014]
RGVTSAAPAAAFDGRERRRGLRFVRCCCCRLDARRRAGGRRLAALRLGGHRGRCGSGRRQRAEGRRPRAGARHQGRDCTGEALFHLVRPTLLRGVTAVEEAHAPVIASLATATATAGGHRSREHVVQEAGRRLQAPQVATAPSVATARVVPGFC